MSSKLVNILCMWWAKREGCCRLIALMTLIIFLLVPMSSGGFPSGSAVKNPPAMQDPKAMWVRSLDQKDPPEENITTHSSILAWRIPWTVEPGGLQPMGSQKSQT